MFIYPKPAEKKKEGKIEEVDQLKLDHLTLHLEIEFEYYCFVSRGINFLNNPKLAYALSFLFLFLFSFKFQAIHATLAICSFVGSLFNKTQTCAESKCKKEFVKLIKLEGAMRNKSPLAAPSSSYIYELNLSSSSSIIVTTITITITIIIITIRIIIAVPVCSLVKDCI